MERLFALMVLAGISQLATAADVELWRLDCGEFKDFDISGMSDTFAYPIKKKTLSDGCYLIRHGKQLMLWDTGLSPSVISKDKSTGLGLSQTLPEQLRKIGIEPQQISIIGVSHGHFDHTGQAANFPKARLLMGKADFDAMTSKHSGFGFNIVFGEADPP